MAEELPITDGWHERARLFLTAALYSLVPVWLLLTLALSQISATGEAPGDATGSVRIDLATGEVVADTVSTPGFLERFVVAGFSSALVVGGSAFVMWLIYLLVGWISSGAKVVHEGSSFDDAMLEGAEWQVAHRADGEPAGSATPEVLDEQPPGPEPSAPEEPVAAVEPAPAPPVEESSDPSLDHLFH